LEFHVSIRHPSGVRMRHDPHVSELKKPTDPTQVASALKERGPNSDAYESAYARLADAPADLTCNQHEPG
jgi:hypothetical protein